MEVRTLNLKVHYPKFNFFLLNGWSIGQKVIKFKEQNDKSINSKMSLHNEFDQESQQSENYN